MKEDLVKLSTYLQRIKIYLTKPSEDYKYVPPKFKFSFFGLFSQLIPEHIKCTKFGEYDYGSIFYMYHSLDEFENTDDDMYIKRIHNEHPVVMLKARLVLEFNSGKKKSLYFHTDEELYKYLDDYIYPHVEKNKFINIIKK